MALFLNLFFSIRVLFFHEFCWRYYADIAWNTALHFFLSLFYFLGDLLKDFFFLHKFRIIFLTIRFWGIYLRVSSLHFWGSAKIASRSKWWAAFFLQVWAINIKIWGWFLLKNWKRYIFVNWLRFCKERKLKLFFFIDLIDNGWSWDRNKRNKGL